MKESDDATPYNAYTGRYLEVITRRKEAKNRTLQARRDYNRIARKQVTGQFYGLLLPLFEFG